MKIIVFGDRNMESGFLQAGERCGHTVRFLPVPPSASAAADFDPDAVILMVPSPAALLQDFLVELYEACQNHHPLILLYERQGERTFFAASMEERDILCTYFRQAVEKAEADGVALYCGEYGVIDRTAPQSVVNWYRDIHTAFEKAGIGRAAWTYRQMDFGITDPHYDAVRDELLTLL